MSDTAQYTYGFVPWPDIDCPLSASLQELIRIMRHRHEEIATEAKFGEFRLGLAADGVSLHEIDRVPYHEPETVL